VKKSPFKRLQNATITFTALASAPTANALGNLTVTTRNITVTAYLELKDHHPKDNRPEGVPIISDYFEGHATSIDGVESAIILPPQIHPLSKGEAMISGERGSFTMDGSIINPPYGREGIGAILERKTGTKFGGWFVRSA
jgi:hypothetical protein